MGRIIEYTLVPPVVLKLAATGYRFARYYSRSVAYGSPGRHRHSCAWW